VTTKKIIDKSARCISTFDFIAMVQYKRPILQHPNQRCDDNENNEPLDCIQIDNYQIKLFSSALIKIVYRVLLLPKALIN
jgi:hypothetical protein